MTFTRPLSLSSAFLFGLLVAAPASAQSVVSTPPFRSIELEGGGHVSLRHGAAQQVRLLHGSTQFTHFAVEEGKLRIEACNDECPNRYGLEVEITTPDIEALAISGGGSIVSEDGFPSARKLALAINGGGKIDARTIDCARATAAVDGGGHIMVRAKDELTAAVNGGGHIAYWGNPRLNEAVDGGGSVEHGE